MPVNYHAYLVRLWRDDENAPWRVRVQSAQEDRAFLFATVEELTLFLSRITGTDPAMGGSVSLNDQISGR